MTVRQAAGQVCRGIFAEQRDEQHDEEQQVERDKELHTVTQQAVQEGSGMGSDNTC